MAFSYAGSRLWCKRPGSSLAVLTEPGLEVVACLVSTGPQPLRFSQDGISRAQNLAGQRAGVLTTFV
jgi:hypothetical protein